MDLTKRTDVRIYCGFSHLVNLGIDGLRGEQNLRELLVDLPRDRILMESDVKCWREVEEGLARVGEVIREVCGEDVVGVCARNAVGWLGSGDVASDEECEE